MRKLRFVEICVVIAGMIGVGIMDKAVPMIFVLGCGVGILVGEIVGDKWIIEKKIKGEGRKKQGEDRMRKMISVVLVGLMIMAMAGYIQAATAQEGNDLEELVGLKVNIVYQITGTMSTIQDINCEGWIVEIRKNWIIVLVKEKKKEDRYVWCYIPTIRKIKILHGGYKPKEQGIED